MEFLEFQKKVYRQFGLNLEGYKEKQLRRRILSLMQSQGTDNFNVYFEKLVKEEGQLEKFLDKVTINVSEFFRNPEIFKALETKVLAEMLKEKPNLKIWSAACSNGSEPYSIAIILDELAPRGRHQIDATDIDKMILEKAKKGYFEDRFLKNVSKDRLQKYFTPQDKGYLLKDQIRNKVNFRHHDLLLDRYGQGYDLIVCRNVTIYFTNEAQELLYKNFWQALNPGGYLFIGATENMLRYRELNYEKSMAWFYRKPLN